MTVSVTECGLPAVETEGAGVAGGWREGPGVRQEVV